MNTYRVKKINLDGVTTLDEYLEAEKKAAIVYCEGLDEVKKYCGVQLRRERAGYSGIVGNVEYHAERI